MGQKINPNVFQTGKTKKWKSKYIEKKSTESSFYVFTDLEIKKFLDKFLKQQGLKLHSCKLNHFEDSLHITISYYLGAEFVKSIKNLKSERKLSLVPKTNTYKKNTEFIKKYRGVKNKAYMHWDYKKTIHENSNWSLNLTETKQKQRLKLIQYYKTVKLKKKLENSNFDTVSKNSFLNKINDNINLFNKNKKKIVLNLYQINNKTKNKFAKNQIVELKKNVSKLRRYKQNSFFKEAVHTIFSFLRHDQSASFLAKFISNELKNQKRHNFFLNFVKKTITILNKKKFCQPKNIQIKIKGRLNGTPRSRVKTIKIGSDIPVISLNSNIDYAESTVFSSNGTLGVKVWSHSP